MPARVTPGSQAEKGSSLKDKSRTNLGSPGAPPNQDPHEPITANPGPASAKLRTQKQVKRQHSYDASSISKNAKLRKASSEAPGQKSADTRSYWVERLTVPQLSASEWDLAKEAGAEWDADPQATWERWREETHDALHVLASVGPASPTTSPQPQTSPVGPSAGRPKKEAEHGSLDASLQGLSRRRRRPSTCPPSAPHLPTVVPRTVFQHQNHSSHFARFGQSTAVPVPLVPASMGEAGFVLRPSGAVSPLRLPPEVLDYWDSEASQDIEATPLPHFLPYDLLSDKRRSISTAAAPPSSGAMGFDKFQPSACPDLALDEEHCLLGLRALTGGLGSGVLTDPVASLLARPMQHTHLKRPPLALSTSGGWGSELDAPRFAGNTATSPTTALRRFELFTYSKEAHAAACKLQHFWRSIYSIVYNKRNRASVRISQAYRALKAGREAREELKHRRAQARQIKQALNVLGPWLLSFVGRLNRRKALKAKAGLKLQAYWRVGLAKRVSRRLRRERGAVLLQALVRGFRVRRRLRFTRQRHAAAHHATTIQRVFRGFYARQALRALRAFRRRKARTIWRAYKGYRYRRYHHPARVIQQALRYRGLLLGKRVRLQRMVRGMLARRRAGRARRTALWTEKHRATRELAWVLGAWKEAWSGHVMLLGSAEGRATWHEQLRDTAKTRLQAATRHFTRSRERHLLGLQAQPLLSSDSTTIESASLEEDEGGSQATPGDDSGGNEAVLTQAPDGSIAEKEEEGEGEGKDEEEEGDEEEPSEEGSDGEEGHEPLETVTIAEPQPQGTAEANKGQADGRVPKPVSSLTRLFLSRLPFTFTFTKPALPPLPQAPPPKTAPSSASSLASSATPEADPPLPLLEAPAPLPPHVFFVPKPQHQPGLAWAKASPPDHLVTALARTFLALQDEDMQEARAEAASYTVAAQKTALQAMIYATVDCVVGLFAWPIVEEGEEGEGRVLPGHALPHALTALGFDQQQQWELVGHEVWLTGGSKPKDRQTHDNRALARYYDLEAVCACLYPWCLDKAVQEGLTWAVLETNPDKPSMSHKGDKTLVLSTLYFLLSTQHSFVGGDGPLSPRGLRHAWLASKPPLHPLHQLPLTTLHRAATTHFIEQLKRQTHTQAVSTFRSANPASCAVGCRLECVVCHRAFASPVSLLRHQHASILQQQATQDATAPPPLPRSTYDACLCRPSLPLYDLPVLPYPPNLRRATSAKSTMLRSHLLAHTTKHEGPMDASATTGALGMSAFSGGGMTWLGKARPPSATSALGASTSPSRRWPFNRTQANSHSKATQQDDAATKTGLA